MNFQNQKYLSGIVLLALLLLVSFKNLSAQSTKQTTAWGQFDQAFEVKDVGNMHVYSATVQDASPDFYFYGTPLDRGLYGIFSANWRKELPADFQTYALYKIRHGEEDAYIMRFSGSGTQNMIAMFARKNNKLKFVRTLATYECSETSCFQMDSWLQDFDGDTRLDILQKARVEQFTLMGAPIDKYSQKLRQRKDGTYYPSSELSVDLSDYSMKTADN